MAADDTDKASLSPEAQMRAAIRGDYAALSAETPTPEPVAKKKPAPRARTPMIDREGDDEPAASRPRGNPFAVAPPVLIGVDSGAGMGFEFRPKRRRR